LARDARRSGPSPLIGRRRAADFPRPPAIEKVEESIRIVLGGVVIATTSDAWRILETFHPPTYYLPPAAFAPGVLTPTPRTSFCEWKGVARYLTVTAGNRSEVDAAWTYPDPSAAYAALRDHVAVYAGRMDACFVGEERVTPQEGGFYGGWITSAFEGPFKGPPGTRFW
jgi:uncharacterized protein (DUF427 family)